MDTKQFVTLAVGLIVGIILISGVVSPVIAESIGSDSEERVEFTNTGDLYFQEVSATTNLSIQIESSEVEDSVYMIEVSINDGEPVTIGPDWASEQSFDNTIQPMFVFKTSDGKIGMEGVVCASLSDSDTEFVKRGAPTYVRWIASGSATSEPSFTAVELDTENPETVTLSDRAVQYSFDIEQINATYILCPATDTESASYTRLSDTAKVFGDTQIYLMTIDGSTSVETDPDTGDPVVVGDYMYYGAYGTVSTVTDKANSICFGALGVPNDYTATLSDTVEGDVHTLDINGITVTATYSDGGESEEITHSNLYQFIVPVKVSSGGTGSVSSVIGSLLSVIPLLMVVGLVIATITFIRRD